MTWIDPIKQKLYRPKKALVAGVRSLPELAWFLVRPRPQPSSTILLAGSTRSGTTWLADVLTAGSKIQQLFEPLHPYWSSEVREVAGWTKELYRMHLHYLRPEETHPAWNALLEKALSGQIRNWGWTDDKRTSYLPERYLIKLVRANLMLGYLYNNFALPIIYLIRHPCAVTLSRLKTKSHCSVRDLLDQEALVEDHLKPWVAKIEKVEDRLEALAIWWAVENMVAREQLKAIPHLFLTYEDLVLHPQEETSRAFGFLDMPSLQYKDEFLQTPSRTSRGAIYSAPEDRLAAWQKELAAVQQEQILYWAHSFGIDTYDCSPFPRVEIADER